MNNNNAIEENKRESDQLVYKALLIGVVLISMNFVVLALQGKVESRLVSWLPGLAAFFVLIPIIYYKFSKEKQAFFTVALISVECTSACLFMSTWLYGALVWMLSFGQVCLYFDTRVMKKLVIVKIPIMIVCTFLAVVMLPERVIPSNTATAVSVSIYYIFQLIIIGYLFIIITKKTNKIFVKTVEQGNQMASVYDENIKGTKQINENINELYHHLNSSVEAIVEVSETSVAITEKSIEMAAKADQGEESVESMMAQLELTTKSTEDVELLTKQMAEVTKVNQENIMQLFNKIHEIEESNNKSKEEFNLLLQSTKSISNAVGIINEVSDETTLLALNASIEAARAGEAGKGFAVVASEISKLAEESNMSAGDINRILNEMTTNTEQSLQSMNDMQHIIAENLTMIHNTQSDFKRMFSIQNDVITRIDELQQYMREVKSSVDNVKFVIKETQVECNSTTDDIQGISAVLEQLNASFQTIEAYAKQVQESSDGLVSNIN